MQFAVIISKLSNNYRSQEILEIFAVHCITVHYTQLLENTQLFPSSLNYIRYKSLAASK